MASYGTADEKMGGPVPSANFGSGAQVERAWRVRHAVPQTGDGRTTLCGKPTQGMTSISADLGPSWPPSGDQQDICTNCRKAFRP